MLQFAVLITVTQAVNCLEGGRRLVNMLEANCFEADQVFEGPFTSPEPLDFDTMDLGEYKVILFGSKNADYAPVVTKLGSMRSRILCV